MNKIIPKSIFFCVMMVTLTVVGMAQDSESGKTPNPAFKVGQVWSYKTRTNEPKSTFMIVKIDSDAKYGDIIHISLRDLKMKNFRSPDGISDKINHMPFSQKAIILSAVEMLRENAELPDFKEGYDLWRKAFDQGRAGFYTISVAEAVSATEEIFNR